MRRVFASKHGAGIRLKYVLIPCSASGKHRFVPILLYPVQKGCYRSMSIFIYFFNVNVPAVILLRTWIEVTSMYQITGKDDQLS